MSRTWISPGIAAVIVLTFALGAGFVSQRFPPVSSDEVVNSVYGWNALSGLGHRYSINDDVFDPRVYAMRDASPDIARFYFNIWIGSFLKATSRTWRHARWSSIATGVFCLLLLYALGRRLENEVFACVLMATLAFNPLFFLGTLIVRPEIELLLAGLSGLSLLLIPPERWAWKEFLAGGVLGLSLGLHPNGLVLLPGFLAFQACRQPRQWRTLGKLLLGWLAGVVLAMGPVDIARLKLSFQSLMCQLVSPPPILTRPWTPWLWVKETWQAFSQGTTFFVRTDVMAGWTLWVGFSWIALLVCAGLALFPRPKNNLSRALGWALLAMFMALSALAKRKEVLYALILYPFLIPLCATGLYAARRRMVVLAVPFVLYGAAAVFFARYALRYSRAAMPYDQLLQQVQRHTAPNDKVIAPSVFWFGVDPDHYRDVSAVYTSGWYTGGDRHVGLLAHWQPDVLVCDENWQRVVLRGHSLNGQEGLMAQSLGTIDTGAAYGVLTLYRLHWKRN